jgi:pyruvate dehydrogenase E2 component (dihydrolipoamide acetyltransferase)
MPYEFKFPDVGEGITEGEIVRWLVKEGDRVGEHQSVVEIETDKAVVQLPSPKAGTVVRLHHREGDTVKVGETLVTIEEKGTPAKPAAKPIEKAKAVSVVGELEEAPEEEAPKPEEKMLPKVSVEHALATPAVRRIARELSVDLAKVEGTGVGGRVTEEDVRRAAEGAKPKPLKAQAEAKAKITKREFDLYGYIERMPLRGIRKATAKHMDQAVRTAAHVTHMDEADVTHLWEVRESEKKIAEKKGVHLTFLPYIIKACIAALKDFPYFNATLDDEHEEIILKKYYNIGVAVDTPDGLIVPVIKAADMKSLLQLAVEIEKLAKAAEARTLDLAELKGGTFTITNIGVIGGTHATPIVNWPEVAILGTGRIKQRAVVRDGAIQARYILPLSLSFDHRVVDGAAAARFMNRIIQLLEEPDLLLLEEEGT